jgi:two-component system response regulator FixJ
MALNPNRDLLKEGYAMNESMVYVVDDDPAILESVEQRFGSEGMIVRTYSSAEAFASDTRFQDSGCLILDLHMPGMPGIKLIEWMRLHQIEMPIVVLTGHGNIPAVVESMRFGATEFFQKPATDGVLVKRVRELLEADAARRGERAQIREIRDRFATLTERERELVELLAIGLSSKQIAAKLGIAVKTVENHRSKLLAKTEAPNVVNLVRMRMITVNNRMGI